MAVGLEQLDIKGIGGTQDINAAVFALSNIASREIGGVTYQVCAYKTVSSKLAIGLRTYPFGRWRIFHYDGNDQADLGSIPSDAHLTAAIDIDADGLVHIAWDMHDEALQYRRSSAAIGSWTGGVTTAQSMLGTNEGQVTYPCFFRSPVGTLYFTFRDGVSGNGDQYFYVWNDTTDTWAAAVGAAGKLIDGKANSFSPYLNGAPKFSSNWNGSGTGFMHWSWCWRDTSSITTNEDILHVRWDGTNWTTIGGSSQTIPITKSNADIALELGPSEGILNSVDFDIDSNGNPVVAVIHDDGGDESQLYALHHNGTSWTETQITSFGTSAITDWGRPIVVIDRTTNTCHIIGGNRTSSSVNIQQWTSDPNDYTTWTAKVFYAKADFGGTEFGYDRKVWLDLRNVCCLITPSRHSSVTPVPVKILERRPKDASLGPTRLQHHAITISSALVGTGGVSDFSVLLTRACFDNEVCDPNSSNAAQPDGGDLQFTSDEAGENRLPCHIVKFEHDSDTDEADADIEIYVKFPSLSASVDTVFYVWYKVSSPSAQPFVDETNGQYAAYDGNRPLFLPYSRQMDSVSADGPIVTRRAITTINSFGAGKVSESFTTTGSPSGWQFDTSLGINIANAYSIAAWVSVAASLSQIGQILTCDRSVATTDRVFQFRVETSGLLTFIRANSSQTLVANFSGTTDLRNAGFKRVWAVFDTTNGSVIYIDGSSDGTNSTLTANRNLGDNLGVGYREHSTDDTFFNGSIDSVELHTASRNQAWITTDFNNQSNPGAFASPGEPTGGGENQARFQVIIIV